jgi:hypothetical protein
MQFYRGKSTGNLSNPNKIVTFWRGYICKPRSPATARSTREAVISIDLYADNSGRVEKAVLRRCGVTLPGTAGVQPSAVHPDVPQPCSQNEYPNRTEYRRPV